VTICLPPLYVEHLVAPRRLGDLLEPEATGEAGSMVGGMGVRVTVAYRPDAFGEAVVRTSAARVFGSVAPIAPASLLMERVQGLSPEQAHEIEPAALLAELAGSAASHLPVAVSRGAAFAVAALRHALATGGERPADPHGPGVLVCRCLGVGDRQVELAVRRGAVTPEEVGDLCGAGRGCGSCRPDVACLIHETRSWRALPPAPDLPPLARIAWARVGPVLAAHGFELRDVVVTDGAVRLGLVPPLALTGTSLRGAEAIARHVLRESVCERIGVQAEARAADS
jgi:bacterioferritin-associated ferredoxin